jgi:hypothetical protein
LALFAAHAIAKFFGPCPFMAIANSWLDSASSTFVYAAQFMTTSKPITALSTAC